MTDQPPTEGIIAELMQELEALRQQVAVLKREASDRKQVGEELRRTTDEMEAVFRALPDLKLRLGLDGSILDFQAGSVVKPPAPRERLLNKRIQDVVAADVGEQYTSAVRQVAESGTRMRFEYAERLDGQTAHYEARVFPLRDGEVLAVVRDVTGRRLQEVMRTARLRVHEAVLSMKTADEIEQVLRVINQNLVRLDVPFAHCAINVIDGSADPPLLEQYSLTEGENSTEVMREAGAWNEGMALIVDFWRRGVVQYRPDLQTDDPHDERDNLDPFRSIVDIPFSHGTLAFNSHLPNAFSHEQIELMQEVADMLSEGFQRMEDLQRIAAERERLIVTLQSMGEGVIATDRDARILLMNQVSEQWTGWTQAEAEGKPLDAVFCCVDEEQGQSLPGPAADLLTDASAAATSQNVILVSKATSERPIEYRAAPIRGEDGQVVGVVIVFRDLTEERRRSAERLRAQKLESVGLLAGGIAHDFNNILVGIMGNVSLARVGEPSPEQMEEILAEVEGASRQVRNLTQQLLTFSKGGAPILETASIAQIIRDSAQFVLRGSASHCEYEIAQDLWPAQVDRGQISQVVHNLILNALQAMPQGGLIRISAKNRLLEDEDVALEPGSYVEIAVADEGVGIAPQHLQTIFDPYFTTKQEGSGLGLATSFSIVKNHGGHLTAYSEQGKGSVFRMQLPAAPTAGLKAEEDEQEIVTGEGRVLVMDDDELVQGLAKRMLERLGYDVHLARNGEEALRMYQAAMGSDDPYMAVIMDLTIKDGMGGRETIEKLLELDPDARSIVSSGYSHDPIMAQSARYGFSGVISKPYDIRSLSHVVSQVTSQSAGQDRGNLH